MAWGIVGAAEPMQSGFRGCISNAALRYRPSTPVREITVIKASHSGVIKRGTHITIVGSPEVEQNPLTLVVSTHVSLCLWRPYSLSTFCR